MKKIGQLHQVKLFIAITIAFLIVINGVFAFAITTPHFNERPLNLYPGETRVVNINLQNKAPADSEDLIAEVELSSDIAVLFTGQTIYDLPYGSSSDVQIEVSMPEDVELGTTYSVRLRAKSTPKINIARGVGMNIAAVVSFPVVAIERTSFEQPTVVVEEKKPSGVLSALMLLALIIIVIAIISRRKKRIRKRKTTRKKRKKK